MTFAALEDTEITTISSFTGTPSIDLPASVDADDCLLAFVVLHRSTDYLVPAFAQVWETLLAVTIHPYMSLWVLHRVADGTEDGGSLDWTTTGPFTKGGGIVRRYSGAFPGGRAVGVELVSQTFPRGFGDDPDPPALTAPWGSADTTWEAVQASGNTGANVTAYPSGYGNGATTGTGGSVVVSAANRQVAAESEDPGPFDLDDDENTWAVTVAIRAAGSTVAAAPDNAVDAGAASTGAVMGGSSPATFTATSSGPVDSATQLLVDLDGDGLFLDPLEDWTDYVQTATLEVGKNYTSQLTGRTTPARFRALLVNTGDRFNRLNPGTPLIVPPLSLRPGRKVRWQVEEAEAAEPVLYTRDRFGESGVLVETETAEPWAFVGAGGGWTAADGGASCSGDGRLIVDLRHAEAYWQATWRHVDDSAVSLVYRYLDDDNYGLVELDGGTVTHYDVTGGSPTAHGSAAVEIRPRLTLGVRVTSSDDVTVYLEGVPLFTDEGDAHDGDGSNVGTGWGLDVDYRSQRNPVVEEVGGWDDIWQEATGLMFTGDLVTLTPSTAPGPERWAVLEAYGQLARLDRPDVTPPESIGQTTDSPAGVRTGHMVGAVLREAGLLHPPPPGGLDPGILLGSVGTGRAKAGYLARLFETTEVGSLTETRVGPPTFVDRDGRAAQPVRAALGDTADYQFQLLDPFRVLDQRQELFNRVTAEISPVAPEVKAVAATTGNHAGAAEALVQFAIPSGPTAEAGDLLVAVLTPACQVAQELPEPPAPWVALRNDGRHTEKWFARRLTTASLGSTVTLYDAQAVGGGAWIVTTYLVGPWYGVLESGLALSEPSEAAAGDYSGPTVFVPWGDQVSLFIATRSGMTTASSGAVSSTDPDDAPNGYHDLTDDAVAATVSTADVGQQTAWRHAVQAIETASQFGGTFTGFTNVEASVLAIRGGAGDPPAATTGELITTDDLDSQTDLQVVSSFPELAQFLPGSTAVDDYSALVLVQRAAERPLLVVTIDATSSSVHRWLAYTTEVGDKLRVIASGAGGIGLNALYYVETVRHDLTDGSTRWVWQATLSPV